MLKKKKSKESKSTGSKDQSRRKGMTVAHLGNEQTDDKLKGEFEVSLEASGEDAKTLDEFFAGVEEMEQVMARLKDRAKTLFSLDDEIAETMDPVEKKSLRADFSKVSGKTEKQFETLRTLTKQLKSAEFKDENTMKLKHNILNGLNMKTTKLLLQYKAVLNSFNLKMKEDTWKEMKEQQLDENDRVVKESFEHDPKQEQVGDFMQKFIFREQAQNAKRYLDEKQRDLEMIERNMVELSELMRDFAVMVESANEPLEQIDVYLQETKANMVIVEENLKQAKYKVLGMRKKKLYTALGVIAVVVIVVAVVVGIVCLL